ncbi:hypothetical protein Tco_1377635 [Tanacetum coccineum]|uniref:Integrase, catalytic region, zinc finger, CCHC-type, peptidase aspartic, catalytic n=1 Tax=Tanacetum coccineum TaxID=301880 RepID=A0ABQ4WV56_9ASTR
MTKENKLEMADTQAEIILSQGLPRHIFNILNQTSTAKEIWDNVEMLMQGSGRTLQQRKEDLFDEYERFRAIGNESIHDYFLLGKYVTIVKQNMDISNTPYVQIYTISKPTSLMPQKGTSQEQEQSTSIVDPWPMLPLTSAPLFSFTSSLYFHPPTNQLGLLPLQKSCTVHDRSIVNEPIQRKAPGTDTTNMFQANHEDAYDSDVDEGYQCCVVFMATCHPLVQHSQVMRDAQDEHLDSDAETEIDDNRSQGHAKVNQEKCLEVETLKNELSQCKQEIYRLDTQKVKLDLEHKVRLEQALVIQQEQAGNAELVQNRFA